MTATRADILRAMAAETWALDPRSLESLAVMATIEEMRAAATRSLPGTGPRPVAGRETAVIPIFGFISHRSTWFTELFGGTSTESILASLRAALADKSIDRVVLHVDSPGGGIFGVPELAAAIRTARNRKPVIAAVEGLAASAAYWLASQATAIIASPSSDLGSIGVYGMHLDISRALDEAGIVPTYIVAPGPQKVELAPELKLSEPARAYQQAQVDQIYSDFVSDVALGRHVSRTTVRETFGGGRVVDARQAVSLGMATQIGTLEDVIGWGSHQFESERRAHAGLRAPTYAMERAERHARIPERSHR